jgi:hypothetical protein
MRRNAKKKTPDIVFREGKPVAVILDIDEYQELLKRLEDKHDFMTYRWWKRCGGDLSSSESWKTF